MATTNNEAVVQSELPADAPIAPTLLWELVAVVWEAIADVVLVLLVFLVGFSMSAEVL